MAIAPTTTNRGTPGGFKLKDGYRTLITFEENPEIEFWEKSVTPLGIDGGEKIEETTMHNEVVRTAAPRSLFSITDSSITVAYDPRVMPEITTSLINVNTVITVTFSDDSQICYYGYLQKFMPNELKEGEQPEAQVTIVATNTDVLDEEEVPIYFPAP